MIVVGIDTSTPQVSIAIGTETAILGRIQIGGKARQESVTPALHQLLAWTGVELDHVGGFVVGTGPGLFTGLRVEFAADPDDVRRITVATIGPSWEERAGDLRNAFTKWAAP